jgi:glycosyltransferase involved in cell wall biosynthesis
VPRAALSTLGLIESFRQQGIASCAVCDDGGSSQEREGLRDAVHGDVFFTRLYTWNRKTRLPLWRRPLSQAKQIVVTGWSFGSTKRVAECAVRWNADLIHTNTILTPEGGLAARRLGLPHLWHLREMLGPGHPFRLPYEGAPFGQYMAAHCSKLVANSHASAEPIRSWVSDDLLEIVPNGIDISRFYPRAGAAAKDRVVVAMVGNMTSRWKKHALFTDAAARVNRSLPIEWRIYGHDPSQRGTVKGDVYVDNLHARLAKAGIADRFVWPGHLANPSQIMSEIYLLVHPADSESFGRVVVEAMAAGLPVVGVRGGGVSEIIDDGRTGLVAEADNADEIAAHIERFVRDPQLRAQFGAAGRRRAEEVYSLKACAEGILRVYEQAMRRPLTHTSRAVQDARRPSLKR